jgi:biopolymer transport protein ExbD
MDAPRPSGLTREPNVLPLIDILLVLIIAAMLPWLIPQWRVDVQVPVPADQPTAGERAPSAELVLSIAQGPSYRLNGHAIARDSLVAALAAVYADRPEKILFIDAARSVPYRDVFWVYGAVRGAGVKVEDSSPTMSPARRKPAPSAISITCRRFAEPEFPSRSAIKACSSR